MHFGRKQNADVLYKKISSFEEIFSLSAAEFANFIKLFLKETHRGDECRFDETLHHGMYLGKNTKDKILMGFVFQNEDWKREDGSFYCHIDVIEVLKEASKRLSFVPKKIFLFTPHFTHSFLLHESEVNGINVFGENDFRAFLEEGPKSFPIPQIQTNIFETPEKSEKNMFQKFSLSRGTVSQKVLQKNTKESREKKFEKAQIFAWSTLGLFAIAGFLINPDSMHLKGNLSEKIEVEQQECLHHAEISSSSEVERKEKMRKCMQENTFQNEKNSAH